MKPGWCIIELEITLKQEYLRGNLRERSWGFLQMIYFKPAKQEKCWIQNRFAHKCLRWNRSHFVRPKIIHSKRSLWTQEVKAWLFSHGPPTCVWFMLIVNWDHRRKENFTSSFGADSFSGFEHRPCHKGRIRSNVVVLVNKRRFWFTTEVS